MHYGIEVVPFGDFSDPRAIVHLAELAEEAGWEGLWIWDHVVMPYGVGDPWVMLAAVAARTKKLKLCVGVSPLPRYRPHLLARTLIGLDLLSQGRLIFATGLGIDSDFAPFGEPAEAKTRAAMLDEGLDLLTGYLSGEPVSYKGSYYTADAVRLVPAPLQKPCIPIWIGGDSPAALRRAARRDGWIMGTVDETGKITKAPEQIAKQAEYIRGQRTVTTPENAGLNMFLAPLESARPANLGKPFDIAVDGLTEPGETALPKEYEQAGATWWFEILHQMRGPLPELERRIQAGLPK